MSLAIEKMFRLDGRRALVTGASSGLGKHFALALARAGAHVTIAARRVELLAETLSEIKSGGCDGASVAIDVTDSASVAKAIEEAQAQGAIDVLVNNAGVGIDGAALALAESEWDRVIDCNLKGAWLVATEWARHLVKAKRGGSMVNIASILAERVSGNLAPYAVSKAGLTQMTRALALEWARHGIRVNALLPGYISTAMNRDFLASEAGEKLRSRIPTRRFGEANDLDGALLLLASDAGRHITGAALPVDGGHLVSSL